MKNFLPSQYKKDKKYKIKHNYLTEQFKDYNLIFRELKKVIKFNDFTLGKNVDRFENKIKKLLKSKYVISVGSGTDAIMLSLKCIGVREGDELLLHLTLFMQQLVIATLGAKPVFVDVQDDYNLDPKQIEKNYKKN